MGGMATHYSYYGCCVFIVFMVSYVFWLLQSKWYYGYYGYFDIIKLFLIYKKNIEFVENEKKFLKLLKQVP